MPFCGESWLTFVVVDYYYGCFISWWLTVPFLVFYNIYAMNVEGEPVTVVQISEKDYC